MNAQLTYAIVEVQSVEKESTSKESRLKVGNVLKDGDRKLFLVVASELVPTLQSKWGVKLVVKKTFPGSALENSRLDLLSEIYDVYIIS